MENNEKNNKKAIITLVVGIGVLLVLIFSATFAYFSVTSTNNFGNSTINAQAEAIGSVALNGTSSNLRLDLSAVDMMKGENDITYWGTSDGTPSTTQNVVTIGSTQVTGAGYFDCNYTLSVTATATNNMYTAFQGMTGKSTEQIVLKIGDTKYDFNTANLFPITINGTLNGVTSSDVQNITAEFYLVNKEDVNQNAIQGTDITMTITATNFSCSVGTPPPPASETLAGLAKLGENSSKIIKYSGGVTDRYQDYGDGVQATKVYTFSSNDINNVIFEDYCWKIIRTTETGGVKLLYNGLPSSGQCLATGISSMIGNSDSYSTFYSQDGKIAYVGYMYNKISGTLGEMLYADDVNVNNSEIKTRLESWFANSGIDERKLEDAVFCNDRSFANRHASTNLNAEFSTGWILFGGTDGLKNLNCKYQTDSFSKSNPKARILYKVGLMSVQEAELMGETSFNNSKYWLSSPFSFEEYITMWTVYDNNITGLTFAGDDPSALGVRPVISVSSSVKITGGTGSTVNPFIFE